MSEQKPVRDFKFKQTWAHSKEQHDFEVEYLGGAIGIVWQRREGEWTFKRQNRTRYSSKRFKNRIGAARALADEPVANPASRYARKGRSRRKSLTADRLMDMSGDELLGALGAALDVNSKESVFE